MLHILISLRARLLVVLAGSLLTGCSFHRTVVNDGVRYLDPSFITVGKTTFREVLKEFGPPRTWRTDMGQLGPPLAGPDNLGDFGVPSPTSSIRHLKYSCADTRVTRLDLAYWLHLPFNWSDEREVEELLVEFDEKGVVSGVFRSLRDTIRPPLQGEGSRLPLITENLERRALR